MTALVFYMKWNFLLLELSDSYMVYYKSSRENDILCTGDAGCSIERIILLKKTLASK